jgi:hypothetical protein
MRKFQLLGLAVFALLAFSVIAATSSAFALESVWLVGGHRAEVKTLVLSETIGINGDNTGVILLEDSKVPLAGKVDILCSGIDEGWVGPGSLDEVTLITSLSGSETTEKWIACTRSEGCEADPTPPEARAVGLPWVTELLLEGTIFLDDIVGKAGEEAGWEVRKCLVFGTETSDKCVSNASSADIDNTTEGDVIALFSPTFTTNALCTVGGAGSGIVEGEILIFMENEESLAVSEG